jgi:hypothetical protein
LTFTEREIILLNTGLNALDKRYAIESKNYSIHSESYNKITVIRKEIDDLKLYISRIRGSAK